MPSVFISQVRRQSIFQPFLPAESARPASPSASAKGLSQSSSKAKGTPLGTIVALTVAAIILAVAFGLVFAYLKRRYKEETLKSMDEDSNIEKGAKSPRRPEGPSKPDSGETRGRNREIIPVKGPETSKVSKPPKPSRPTSSESSSESSSSYCSCEDSEDNYPVSERPPQRPKPIYKAPPCRPPIRTPKAPTPRLPKSRYPQQPGRFPGVSRDPRAPPRRNQDSWRTSGTRPPQRSPSSGSRGQARGFSQTWNGQPSLPSPILAGVLPSDIPSALSTGTFSAALQCCGEICLLRRLKPIPILCHS